MYAGVDGVQELMGVVECGEARFLVRCRLPLSR